MGKGLVADQLAAKPGGKLVDRHDCAEEQEDDRDGLGLVGRG